MNNYHRVIKSISGRFVFDLSGESPVQITDSDLDAVVQKIGFPLPNDYREFLKDFGGYSVDAQFFSQDGPSSGEKHSIGTFLGLGIGSSFNLLDNYESDLTEVIISPELLPIAGDESGKVCILLHGNQIGTVQFWCSEEARAPFDYSNLYFVANSFDDFMQSLRPYEED